MKPQLTALRQDIMGTFRNCWNRFPVTVCFTFALTLYLLYIVYPDKEPLEDKLIAIAGYYLSVGVLLSLSLHLWSEEVHSFRTRLIVQITAQLLLLVDAFFLYHNAVEPRLVDIGIAHGAAILTIGLSVFFLPFFREKNDIPAWNFTQYVLGCLSMTVLIGLVMSGGLCLLAYSLPQLFGVTIDNYCYRFIFILFSVLLPILLFLGMLPNGDQKHDPLPVATSFLNSIIRYLFLPLIGGYLLVLYVYAFRIITRWELPDGWVSWLIIALMFGVIAIELALYPTRIKGESTMAKQVTRWLPALVLPLLLLMSVGIARRFSDYGITINRLYLATLNVWFYAVCIGLILSKAKRVNWIPISFTLIFLLTSALPINYASITRNTLRAEIQEALAQSNQTTLPLTEEQYESWIASLPDTEARQINAKLWYLVSWFGTKSTSDLMDERISFRNTAMEEENPDMELLNYNQLKNTTIKVPQGYDSCTFIEQFSKVPHELVNDSMLSLPLDFDNDTVRIPIDTLRVRHQQLHLQPAIFKTQSGNTLVLTYFHFSIHKNQEETEASIDGYLFHNNN